MSVVKKIVRKGLQIRGRSAEERKWAAGYKRYRDMALQGNVVGLKVDKSVRFVRIDPSLNLARQRISSLASIEEILRELRVQHWEIPNAWTKPSRVGVLEADRKTILNALKGAANLTHWTLEPLGRKGHKDGTEQHLPSIDTSSGFRGIRLHERVAPSTNSTFAATSQQGVELHFWSGSSTDIESLVWNERTTKLPHPSVSKTLFQETLSEACRKHADEVDFPIDVVFTWVDGSDTAWQQAKARAMNLSDAESHVQDAADEARFSDHDELRFSLRSIEQYAPWVNRIWVVTDGQTPEWLQELDPRISIVRHTDIWPDDRGLPNFNSHAIEACLHRIEGLSEHFLYFNDDFFLARPVDPEVFFHGNGITKLFYSRALVDFLEINELDNASSIAAKNARQWLRSTEPPETNFSRKFFHVPAPLQKSLLEQAEVEFSDAFEATRRAQFRQSTDIAAAGSFYFNLAQARGRAVPDRIQYDYIDPATKDGRRRLASVVIHHDKDCIVINDGSTPETNTEREQTDIAIRAALQEFLPVRSSFEIDPHTVRETYSVNGATEMHSDSETSFESFQ